MKNDDAIVIRGAKEHNLRNISVSIPRDTLTVITGLSGSGKSSLAFDTIFAEGQRRYVESLSTYARQFIETTDKPEVESIDGLSPTISIQQKTTSHNPRSTVGTVTEVYDFLRLLYARIAKAHCSECGKPITSQTAQQIADQIFDLPDGSRLSILAPMVRGRKGEYGKELAGLRQRGFSRVRIDGEVLDLAHDVSLDKQKKHHIDVFIDRLVLRKQTGKSDAPDPLRFRVLEAVVAALKLADGLVSTEIEGRDEPLLFSQKYSCPDCGISYPEPEPRTFSFNSPMGACKACDGIGAFYEETMSAGEDGAQSSTAAVGYWKLCTTCHGTRLRKEALFYKVAGQDIAALSALNISALAGFFTGLKLTDREALIADRILKEISDRLHFLLDVGVGYLTLERPTQTLSGGESQRIRLASQLGSALTGVIYVLDEPSIGLHQRDNDRLIESLQRLKRNGNTVLVVEHDRDTIMAADHVIDLGPGAGTQGGLIVAEGTVRDLIAAKDSLTGQYLAETRGIAVPRQRRKASKDRISIRGAHANNLKNVDVDIPLGLLTCITGVSGSGKSTLIIDTLYPALMKELHKIKTGDLMVTRVDGAAKIDKIIDIDQSPIGRTPRSNPATYTGLLDGVRQVMTQLPESRMRGFKPGRFSFNVKGGRCEACHGGGMVKVEMHFLADIYVKCETCDGRRFNDETLSIKYRGKSIADLLAMTIDDALPFFENHPNLHQRLKVLSSVGLGYISLGQSSTTLSGGEAQRIKLATELSKRATGKTLYILDEPSTGLHFEDVKRLLELLHQLVDQGNTVIVIEHNLEIIKTADHVIDLGPEAGAEGGAVVASGTPEDVAKVKASLTGQYLKPYLK